MVTRRSTKKAAVDPSLSAFATHERSPFPDKYDLQGERKILATLIRSGDPDPADPLYPRYEMFLEREAKLRQMQAEYQARQGADPIVAPATARQINDLGALQPGAADTMTLHTAEAMRLFMGTSVQPGGTGYPMAGGKRVAAALRGLWSLSSNDNPYADWSLVDISERIADARQNIAADQKRILAKLDETKQKGLDYSIVQSRSPSVVQLGFTSPYGFMIAMLIIDFDFFTRVVKSAQRRDLLSSKEGHELLQATKHRCRSAFERALRFQRVLSAKEVVTLSRLDWLPTADEAGKQRVADLQQILGAIPKDIFMGQRQPRHSKRRLQLSEAELRLLDQVALTEEPDASKSAAAELIQ